MPRWPRSAVPRRWDRGEAAPAPRPHPARFRAIYLVPLLVLPIEFGQRVVHGFGARVEISLLGRFGEPLQYVFDKGLLIRAAFAFGDDVEGNANRVLQFLDRLPEVDNFSRLQAARELENSPPFKASLGGLRNIARSRRAKSSSAISSAEWPRVTLMSPPIFASPSIFTPVRAAAGEEPATGPFFPAAS